jgi:hypothetical protein
MTAEEAVMLYLNTADHIPTGTAIAAALHLPTSTTYRALGRLESAGKIGRQRVMGYMALGRSPRPMWPAPCLQLRTPAPLAAFCVSQGAGL